MIHLVKPKDKVTQCQLIRTAEVIRSNSVSLFGHVECMESGAPASNALDYAIDRHTERPPTSITTNSHFYNMVTGPGCEISGFNIPSEVGD